MSEQACQNIMHPESQTGLGIAVKNVHDRMKGFFGPDACMEVESELGKGTRVLLRFPGCAKNHAAMLGGEAPAAAVANAAGAVAAAVADVAPVVVGAPGVADAAVPMGRIRVPEGRVARSRRGADESVAGAAGAGLGGRRGADGVPAAPAGAPAEGRGEGAGALPVGRRGADRVPAAPAGAGLGSRGDGAPGAAGQGVEGVAALVRDVRELEDVEAQVAARVAEGRSRRAFDPEDAEAQGTGA